MRADDLLERIRPDQRLLLQAILRDDERARLAYREWRRLVVPDDMDHESQRLMPLLARRIEEVGPDDPVRDLVRGIYRHAWVKNQLMAREAAAAATALQRNGIRVLALKGAALVPHYGGDWGSRPMFDLDLLVPFDHLAQALDVLDEAGWHPLGGRSTAWVRFRVAPRRHSTAITRDGQLELDLHWHVLGGSLTRDADARFWADAVPLELAGTEVLALAPSDLLMHVLVHGTRVATRGYVQWIADAVHVIRSTDDDLVPRLASAARQHGQVTTSLAALRTIEALVDEPRIDPLVTELARTRRSFRDRAGAPSPSANRAVLALAAPLKHAGDGVMATAKSYTRARLDLDLVRRPRAYVAYVAAGRQPAAAALVRRVVGTFARTPTNAPAIGLHEAIDFSQPATGDAYGAFGWDAGSDGLDARGREARLVVPVSSFGDGALVLHLDVHPPNRRNDVELRVNERVLARVDLASTKGHLQVRIPQAVAHRFDPMEIALVATRRRLRRSRVEVRLLGLRLTPG